jgi:hypothetical protein
MTSVDIIFSNRHDITEILLKVALNTTKQYISEFHKLEHLHWITQISIKFKSQLNLKCMFTSCTFQGMLRVLIDTKI